MLYVAIVWIYSDILLIVIGFLALDVLLVIYFPRRISCRVVDLFEDPSCDDPKEGLNPDYSTTTTA